MLFPAVDGMFQPLGRDPPPGLYFHKHQLFAVARDKVDLAAAGAHIAVHDPIAELAQVDDGNSFTDGTPLCRTTRQSPRTPCAGVSHGPAARSFRRRAAGSATSPQVYQCPPVAQRFYRAAVCHSCQSWVRDTCAGSSTPEPLVSAEPAARWGVESVWPERPRRMVAHTESSLIVSSTSRRRLSTFECAATARAGSWPSAARCQRLERISSLTLAALPTRSRR